MAEKKTEAATEAVTEAKAVLPSLEEMIKSDNGPKISGEENIELESQESTQEKEESTQNEDKKEDIPQSEDAPASEDPNYESDARDSGWAPKDEFRGDPKLWVDAKEWISRAPLLHKITQQSKELKNLRKNTETMTDMMMNMVERTDKKRTDEILAQRKEAIELGDVVAFDKYDKEYNEAVKTSQEMAQKAPPTSSQPPEVEAFVERNNKWFNDNSENLALKSYAIQVENELMNNRPELTLEQRLRATENIVKDDPRYIKKFSNPNRDRPAAVEGKTAPISRSKDKITFAELPSDVKKIFLEQKRKSPELDLEKMAQKALNSGAVKYE